MVSKSVLSKSQFVVRICDILQLLGLPQQDYTSHSFHTGAATSAAGVEDSTIQILGQWQSAEFLQYIRTPKEQLAALSTLLATASICGYSESRPLHLAEH